MRLHVFRARSATLAMAAAREAMGEEAVILGTRRIGREVELTVARETGEPEWISPVAAPGFELARHNPPPGLRFDGEDLATALAARLGFAPLPEEAPLLLVGPPGAGKTLSCAKLAARARMAGRPPLVVTADDARAGAVEQLAAFTRVLGLTLAVAAQPHLLAKALQPRRPDQPVFIDGFGCDPFDAAQAKRLHCLAQAAAAVPVLVLPAGLDAEEAAELARAFYLLGARHLLPTRLDVARRLGGILAAAAAGLALTEAGIGPQVAGGLQPITPDWLAGRLLGGPKREVDPC